MELKKLSRTSLIFFLLALLTLPILGATLARYTSSTTGTGTANIGQWTQINFEGSDITSTSFNFDLSTIKKENNNVLSTQIAPGDEGSFEVTFGPSEVAYSYTIAVSEIDDSIAGNPNIIFYSDETMTTPLTENISSSVNLTTAQAGFTQTIYWQWEFDGGINSEDTADGLLNSSTDFTITLTATQTGT